MNLLIKSAKIIDTNSKYHNKIMDVFIKSGKIEKIAKTNQSTIGLAKKNQSAIGIGETYPATIMQIARWAKTLKGKMIDLAPISAVVRDKFPQSPESSTEKTKVEQ